MSLYTIRNEYSTLKTTKGNLKTYDMNSIYVKFPILVYRVTTETLPIWITCLCGEIFLNSVK